jgi:predicted ATPase
MLMDDRGTIEVLSTRLLQHTEKFKMTHFHRLARVNVAYVTALKGNPGAGLTEIEKCLSEWLALGYRYFLPIIWIIQIRVQLLAEEEISSAVRAAEVGLAHVAETGEATFAAELHRLQGVIALAGNGEKKQHVAEQAFQTAIEVARGQDARLLELRAATSLARLWRGQGKQTEAKTLLGPIYDWFSEGFAKPDLLEAKGVLQELSPSLDMAH